MTDPQPPGAQSLAGDGAKNRDGEANNQNAGEDQDGTDKSLTPNLGVVPPS